MGDLRVGIDVSPLELTAAGTARYLRKLLEELEGVDVRRYAFPGSSRPRRSSATPPGTWRGCLGGPRRRRRPPLPRPPRAAPLARPAGRDDPRPGGPSPPGDLQPLDAHLQPAAAAALARAAARVIAVSEFTAREAVELPRRRPIASG